jgi:hypothetical protein
MLSSYAIDAIKKIKNRTSKHIWIDFIDVLEIEAIEGRVDLG